MRKEHCPLLLHTQEQASRILLAIMKRAICGKIAQTTLKPSFHQNCLSVVPCFLYCIHLLSFALYCDCKLSEAASIPLLWVKSRCHQSQGWFVTYIKRGSFSSHAILHSVHHTRARASKIALTQVTVNDGILCALVAVIIWLLYLRIGSKLCCCEPYASWCKFTSRMWVRLYWQVIFYTNFSSILNLYK